MQPITSQTLETERAVLRAWRADDLEDFYAYASEPGVGERAGWKHHESREESRRILESFIRAQEVFAVVLRSEQRAIGSLGVHPSWAAELPAFAAPSGCPPRVKEIGYVLSSAYWGRGLMPEAVRAVIEYAFGTLGLEALTVAHFPENVRSKRVIEKCGFTYYGYRRLSCRAAWPADSRAALYTQTNGLPVKRQGRDETRPCLC